VPEKQEGGVRTWSYPALERTSGRPLCAIPVLLDRIPTRPVLRANHHLRHSGKRGQQRLHPVNQMLPGGFDRLLESIEFTVVGFLEILDTPLEFRETRTHALELPIVFQLDTLTFCLANCPFSSDTRADKSSTSPSRRSR